MYLLFIWGGTYGFGWGESHNEGRFWRGGPWNRDFFGPKKVEISGPTPSNGPRNWFPHIQIHTSSPYTCIDVGCRYVRNIGLNKFMSTVEKATVTPHSSKTGETAVLKQVCDVGTDCCWWLAVASCCCLTVNALLLIVADPRHSDLYPSFHFDADPDPTFHFDMDPDTDPASHQLCESAISSPPISTALHASTLSFPRPKILTTWMRVRLST